MTTIAIAVVQAVCQLDSRQIVTYLVQAHGVIDSYPPQVL